MPDRQETTAVTSQYQEDFIDRLAEAMIHRPGPEERQAIAAARRQVASVLAKLHECIAELTAVRDFQPRARALELDQGARVDDFRPGMGLCHGVADVETAVAARIQRWAAIPVDDELWDVIRLVKGALTADEDGIERDVRAFLRQAGPEIRAALADHLGVE